MGRMDMRQMDVGRVGMGGSVCVGSVWMMRVVRMMWVVC